MDEGEGRVLGTTKMLTTSDGTVAIHTMMRDFEICVPAHIQTRKPIAHTPLNSHPAEKQKQAEGYRYRKVNHDEGNVKKQVASVVKLLFESDKFQSRNE